MSVLLAEDEESVGRTTVALFHGAGHRCEWVRTARDVLSALDTGAHEVLVTDIRMPGGDDLRYLAEVRRRAPDVPVIVVTGYPTLPSAIAALRLDVLEYLVKPVDFGVLRASVEEALLLRRAGARLQELAASLARLAPQMQAQAAEPALSEARGLLADIQSDLARLRLRPLRWAGQGGRRGG